MLLPVYQAETYLAESLRSLFAQTLSDFEILAIDDGSRDRSAAILSEFARKDSRIRVVTHRENRGLVETLNAGLGLAKGDIIIRQDADDLAHPDRVANSLNYLREHPSSVLVGSWIRRIDSHGKIIELHKIPETDAELRWQFLFRNPFTHSAVAFRREVALAAGGYSLPAKHAEDYHLWLRLAAHGKIAVIPKFLCDYRVHTESISSRNIREMAIQSSELGASWLERLGGAEMKAKNPFAVENWKRFRNRESLTPAELAALFESVLELARSHPLLCEYPTPNSAADLAWHFLSYLKRRPKLLLDVSNLSPLFKYLPALRAWPKARWTGV